jgi:hypothetical protein
MSRAERPTRLQAIEVAAAAFGGLDCEAAIVERCRPVGRSGAAVGAKAVDGRSRDPRREAIRLLGCSLQIAPAFARLAQQDKSVRSQT